MQPAAVTGRSAFLYTAVSLKNDDLKGAKLMKEKSSRPRFQLNVGSGMGLGVAIGALMALLVSTITGDQSIWSWAIPVGLACGLAVGAGSEQARKDRVEKGGEEA